MGLSGPGRAPARPGRRRPGAEHGPRPKPGLCRGRSAPARPSGGRRRVGGCDMGEYFDWKPPRDRSRPPARRRRTGPGAGSCGAAASTTRRRRPASTPRSRQTPGCPLAPWGRVWSLGPSSNLGWELIESAGRAEALAAAHEATRGACAVTERAAPTERALIAALPARYPEPVSAGDPAGRTARNHAFADTMRAAHRGHPEDLAIRAIRAEAPLDIAPWRMCDFADLGPPPPVAARPVGLSGRCARRGRHRARRRRRTPAAPCRRRPGS